MHFSLPPQYEIIKPNKIGFNKKYLGLKLFIFTFSEAPKDLKSLSYTKKAKG
jgi:hypothetical protein